MNAPISLPSASTLDVHEFPERLGAITVRELRAGLLGRDMVWLLVGVQVILAISGIYALQRSATDAADALGSLQFAVWACALVGLAILSPLRALRALHTDRESRLLELLQLTSLSAGAIVFGKWLSLAVQTALFLVSLLPFFALRYFLGGADLVGDATALAIIFGFSLGLQAVFLLLSTLPKFVRVLALAGLVFALFGMLSVGRGLRGLGMMGSFTDMYRSGGKDAPWVLLYLALLFVGIIGTALSQAARMIAAPAENYAGRTRLWGAAWVLVLVFLEQMISSHEKLGEMATIALVFVGIAAFFELGEDTRLLPAHRPRSWLLRWCSWLLLPGWQSALLFYAILALGLVVPAYAAYGPHLAQLLIPSAVALVLLPRAIFELVPCRWFGYRRLAYYGLQVVFALLALAVGSIYGATNSQPDWPQFLPPMGFWNGLAWASPAHWSELGGTVWAALLFVVLIARALLQLDAAREKQEARAKAKR